MNNLPAGQYAVSATKVNYTWVARGSDRTMGIGAPIRVADGQAIEGLDLSSSAPASYRANSSTSSTSRSWVRVSLWCAFRVSQGQRRLTPGRSTMTNDIGEFRLFGLLPGEWYLSASHNMPVAYYERSIRLPGDVLSRHE